MSQPPELKDLTRVVVRGASLSGAGLVLTQVLNLAIYVVLARLASPTIFGTFAAASILASIGELVSESGLKAALIQRRERLEDALSTAFVAALAGGALFTVLSAGLAPLVGLYFRSREIGLLALAMSAVHLFHSAVIVPEALLTRRFAFVRRLVVDPSATAALGLVSAIALARGLGPWGLLLGLYAYGLVRIVLTWALVAWRPSLRLASFPMWRELVGYGRHVLAASILQQATPAVIVALVGRFVGAASLGQYRFGLRIATSATEPVLAASSYVLFPAFARISTDEHRYGAAFLRALKVLSFYVIPLSFILFAIGEPLTVLLLGDRWRTAGHVLTALCGLGASVAFVSIASTALKSSGRPDIQAKLNFVWTGLTVVLAAVLLPLGVVAVAAAVSFSAAITAAYALRWAARVVRLRPQQALEAIWPPIAAAGITSSAIAVLERLVFDASHRTTGPGLMLLALEIILGASVYLALMAVLRPTMIGEAVHPIKLALGGARASAPPEGPHDQAVLSERSAQRESPGTP
jgi:O-antigen/teichoic acid export membrane protein